MSSQSVVSRAIEKIQTEGFRALLAATPRALATFVRPWVTEALDAAVAAGLCGPLVDERELQNVAENRGRWFEFGNGEPYELPFDDRLPPELVSHAGTYSSRRRFVAELPNALLLGHDAIVLDPDDRIVLESIGGERWFLAYLLQRYVAERRFGTAWRVISRRNVTREPKYGTVLPLLGPHSRTYFHWIAEFLPQLRAFEAWKERTGETATILIDPDPPEWKVASLRCLGVRDEQWATWDGTGVAERALIPPYSPKRPSLFTPSPDDLKWLRERMRVHAAEPAIGCPETLLVSRRDAPNRRIENESEIASRLSRVGVDFEVIVPARYSIPEQIALFSEADSVVAPHGAGLVNAVFSDSIHVVECFQPDLVRPYFYHQAMMLGHEYDCVVGKRIGRDMVVPTDAVVDALLAEPRSGDSSPR